MRAAEADASVNQYGMMSPDVNAIRAGRTVFGRFMYPRMVEIIQLLGTGALMALPAEADFESGIGPEIEQYFATDSTDARDRAKLFHLAWDASCSSFSGRQVLYERMFGGNPVRNSITLFQNYDKEPFQTEGSPVPG